MIKAVASTSQRIPDWDLEQLEVILDDPASWQFVVAGPGAGKSAVACQRIASLVDDGIPPSRILLVSFTRTAVAEIRDRIVSYAKEGDIARGVRITTIDSHAWSLRAGFEGEGTSNTFGEGSYDLSIKQAVELFRGENPDLLDFMSRIEHFIVDEAQDVVGARADLILEILGSLSEDCGVTILADPAQAIYGFTSDDQEESEESGALLQRLEDESPRPLKSRELRRNHRIRNQRLLDVFCQTRHEVEEPKGGDEHIERVVAVIRDTALESLGTASHEAIAEHLATLKEESLLVLFRRRADVLIASSYCSSKGVQHRLRMSGLPLVVRPWVGWLFSEFEKALISWQEFETLWAHRSKICGAPLEGEQLDSAWELLRNLAAGDRPGVVDLVYLRAVLSRSRPPVEVCQPELGVAGPILGTIHASKGREADTVALVLPPESYAGQFHSSDAALEESRVYYVGATRARETLMTAHNRGQPVGRLDSGRVYRRLAQRGGTLPRVQVEIGREGDVDSLAHLSWTNAAEVQRALAGHARKILGLSAVSIPDLNFDRRLVIDDEEAPEAVNGTEIGRVGDFLQADLGKVWSIVDNNRTVRPYDRIKNIYLAGVTTVALSDSERNAARLPFRTSGFALAPVIKGFPMVLFRHRRRGRQ